MRELLGKLGLTVRVVLVAAVVGALTIAFAALLLFQNARVAIAVETSAGAKLARDYTIATTATLMRDHSSARTLELLPNIIVQPRHAHIVVIDRHTGLTHIPSASPGEVDESAPAWFQNLFSTELRQLTLPVQDDGVVIGTVVITPDANAEIGEIWEDFETLAYVAAIAYFTALFALWLVVRRTLEPLSKIVEAFNRLGAGDYKTRIGSAGVPELQRISDRFDQLAVTLETTIDEKNRLNRRLISVQDAERKFIAMELHDELGPCLFGLRVESLALSEDLDMRQDEEGASRARGLLAMVEQVQRANRGLLSRLRPMEIGQLPLDIVLEQLVDRLGELDRKVSLNTVIDIGQRRFDETSELTIYRLVQEAVTNALRHARASQVDIRVWIVCGADELTRAELSVADDGLGMKSTDNEGHGISGMRERVGAVNGVLEVRAGACGGTEVRATVPIVAIARATTCVEAA